MSKTPEQMAEEAINNRWKISGMLTSSDGYVNTLMIRIGGYKDGFIDGYQAAKDTFLAQFKSLLSSCAETSFNPNHTAWQIFDALMGEVAKDQLADADKVMPLPAPPKEEK